MEVNRRKWWIISLAGTVGFFFAIAPVLDPYIVIEIGSGFTLKINDIIMLFLTMLCFAYGHFPRPSGPRSPARQGHIKRPVLRLAEPSFLRPANQCC